VGPQGVADLLAQAHILVLPSFDENLPMSVIEGMAHELAIVTTPVGAVEDIIEDGVTGLLVPPGDAKALARALTRLITDTALRKALGRAAGAFHEEHLEIERYVVRLQRIWSETASHKGFGHEQ
jgi:glycosyltransferase involved in cell wall biosynthesis